MARTYRAVNKDPQELPCDGLQELTVVQLAQEHLALQDVVLQNDLQFALVDVHYLVWRTRQTSQQLKQLINAISSDDKRPTPCSENIVFFF
jgi:hypothetical protein